MPFSCLSSVGTLPPSSFVLRRSKALVFNDIDVMLYAGPVGNPVQQMPVRHHSPPLSIWGWSRRAKASKALRWISTLRPIRRTGI